MVTDEALSEVRARASKQATAGLVLGCVALLGAAGFIASALLSPELWFARFAFWACLVSLPVSLVLSAMGLRAERRMPAILGLVLCAAAIATLVGLQLVFSL